MYNQKVRDAIAEINPDAILFDEPAYDNSIIGLSYDGCVIYDFDSMVEEFSQDNDTSVEDAIDFIEYNTIRALPYAGSMTGSSCTPIILDSFSTEIIQSAKEEE